MARREAFVMFLKKGYEDEYIRRHNLLWPEVRDEIKKSGVYDYSIYLDRERGLLFAYQMTEGSSSQDLGCADAIKRWWHYMSDIMETNEDESPVSIKLEEAFHLD
ncbi:MAG TPA: L-rhamnose mutarotase [Candidatus Ornithospirochaeta avicola]|uniref:L-rhamnose mutarotase n=1 Tax=Candidatus Ornithospirochaeta avicola TaxID=2840896 RepID=A0A9D1PRZ8_9SPIO|nr:L-rhamnose mutarotase [Candidatus Ornithospirochaeta avicola]